jgi:hypothetical protein
MLLVAVAFLGAGVGGLIGAGPVAAGFIGFGAGGVAGGLLAYAMGQAAERAGVGRAAGVSFLPRAVLLLLAFLWARELWPSAAVCILPGYLAGEAVWVARALRHLRRRVPPAPHEATPAEE